MVTKERETPSPRNPREKWAQNLGIRPASQTANTVLSRLSERPAITELAPRFARHAGEMNETSWEISWAPL